MQQLLAHDFRNRISMHRGFRVQFEYFLAEGVFLSRILDQMPKNLGLFLDINIMEWYTFFQKFLLLFPLLLPIFIKCFQLFIGSGIAQLKLFILGRSPLVSPTLDIELMLQPLLCFDVFLLLVQWVHHFREVQAVKALFLYFEYA